MSSRGKQRQQKTPQGGCLQVGAVNPPTLAGAPSFPPAQQRAETCRTGNGLMEAVVERSNMFRALHRVKENRGACGVDGMEIKELGPYLREHWREIRDELLQGKYRPSAVRRVEIPKPGGGVRMLGIPTVIDRVIQQALLQVLTPLFDRDFSDSSFGFRPKRCVQGAVKRAREYIRAGNRYVVDIDLEKFFDRVNHDILMSRVARKVKDTRVLHLIRRYLQAGAMLNGCCVRTEEGTPQGGPISPLLANIMLDDLDKELEQRGRHFARYADDCNIYVKSLRAAKRVFESVSNFIEGRLKLRVNKEKSAVDRPWNRKFLGFSFTGEEETRIRLAPKTIERFMGRVREITGRNKGVSMQYRVARLTEYIRGWFGCFRIIETPSTFRELDKWVRRRLRACMLKQWKRPKTKRRKLVSLNIPDEWARKISGSRKGCWRLSLTPQLNKALGIAYWRDQGLFSLTEGYEKFCQSLRTAVYRTVRTVV